MTKVEAEKQPKNPFDELNLIAGSKLLRAASIWQTLTQGIAQRPEFTQNSGMQPLDESTYHRHLAQTRGPALVLFSSQACGGCRQVERLLPASAPAGAALFKVDVQVAAALARAFEVFHLPTLLLYLDGHYHARLNCEVTPTALQAAIEHAVNQPAEEEP